MIFDTTAPDIRKVYEQRAAKLYSVDAINKRRKELLEERAEAEQTIRDVEMEMKTLDFQEGQLQSGAVKTGVVISISHGNERICNDRCGDPMWMEMYTVSVFRIPDDKLLDDCFKTEEVERLESEDFYVGHFSEDREEIICGTLDEQREALDMAERYANKMAQKYGPNTHTIPGVKEYGYID